MNPGGRAAWIQNLWLLAGGALLLAVTLIPGPDEFVEMVRRLYLEALPQISLVFREDLVRETRILQRVLTALGAGAVVAYGLLARRRLDLAGHLVGVRWSEPGAWRGAVILVVILYSSLFVVVRVVREGLRAQKLAGLSLEERRLRLWGLHTVEPDYRPLAKFRAASGGRGTLAILHGSPPGGFDEMFRASYLFPIRVYAYPLAHCSEGEVAALLEAAPPIDWVQLSCAGSAEFEPRRLRGER